MNLSKSIVCLSLAASLSTMAAAGDYIVKPGEASIGFSLSQTSFDQFYAGSVKQPGVPGGQHIQRTSFRSYLFYGLQENLALDLSVGYADVSSGLSSDSAFTDSQIGLSWQLAHQGESSAFDWLVRAGVNIEGDYETGFLSAPGDGESGFDLMTRFGGAFAENGARADVEFGYTLNGGDVPDGFRLRAGPSFPIGNGLTLDLAGTYFEAAESGIDIGGPGFTGLGDLPKVAEQGLAGEVGLSFIYGGGYYRLSVSQLFDGTNIGEELTFGLYAGFKL